MSQTALVHGQLHQHHPAVVVRILTGFTVPLLSFAGSIDFEGALELQVRESPSPEGGRGRWSVPPGLLETKRRDLLQEKAEPRGGDQVMVRSGG